MILPFVDCIAVESDLQEYILFHFEESVRLFAH